MHCPLEGDEGGAGSENVFVVPRDRNGRVVSEGVSTWALEAAMADYRAATDAAAAAVREVSVCL